MLRPLLDLCTRPMTAVAVLLLASTRLSTASTIPFTLAHIDLTARANSPNLSTDVPSYLPQTHRCQGTFGGFTSSSGAHYVPLPRTGGSTSPGTSSGYGSTNPRATRAALNVTAGEEVSAVFYINSHGGYTCASRFALGLVPAGKAPPASILSMDWAGQVGIDGRSSSSMRVRDDEVPLGMYDAHFFQYIPENGNITDIIATATVDMTGNQTASGNGNGAQVSKQATGTCVCPSA